MALKVIISPGRTEVTVNGLHQWDYGREIEIHADNLPALVEVHFACAGMETAVVRNCAVLDGKVTAAVPDLCLEQTTPVLAWVYAVGETSGETILTIKLPIAPRTKPQPGASIPEEVSDRYTEAVAAMNALVEECEKTVTNVKTEIKDGLEQSIKDGALVVGEATHANSATTADSANKDNEGKELKNLLRCAADGYTRYASGASINGGLVAFKVSGYLGEEVWDVVLIADVGGTNHVKSYSAAFYNGPSGKHPLRLEFTNSGNLRKPYNVTVQALTDAGVWVSSVSAGYSVDIYYKYLIEYPAT